MVAKNGFHVVLCATRLDAERYAAGPFWEGRLIRIAQQRVDADAEKIGQWQQQGDIGQRLPLLPF